VANLIKSTMLFRSLRVFEKSARRKLYISVSIQSGLSILDLLGIAAIGLIGAMSVRGIQSEGNPEAIDAILKLLQIESLSFQFQVAVLGILSVSILIAKTIISMIAMRRIYRFMSNQSAILATELFDRILKKPFSYINELTPNRILYSVTAGCSRISLGITGNYISLIADGFLLIVLFVALIFVDFAMTIAIGIFFGSAIILFHQSVKTKAQQTGEIESVLNIKSNQIVLEGLSSFRERYVRNTIDALTSDFFETRATLSRALAVSAFLPNVTKYLIESLILVGALVICGIQFVINDAGEAIATLSIFIGAATRVTPAIMRIQQSLFQIRNSTGAASEALELIEQLRNQSQATKSLTISSFDYLASPPVTMRNVSYRYPNSVSPSVSNVTLELLEGESIALVGPSGGGKSTIADLILGIAEPSSGFVEIFGQTARDVAGATHGRIGYVPQATILVSDTLRENLLLGLEADLYSDESLISVLDSVELSEEFMDLGITLNSLLGESGSKLSGGQLQRLGIARSLLTSPSLLILDEATSSLDASSERAITNTLNSLKGKTSTIIIAHRLSTIRDVTRIYYVKSGAIIAAGSFEQLREINEEFDTQAKLMGL